MNDEICNMRIRKFLKILRPRPRLSPMASLNANEAFPRRMLLTIDEYGLPLTLDGKLEVVVDIKRTFTISKSVHK